MIKKASKTVICNDKGIYLEDFIFSSESLQCESGGSWSIRKSRLKGGLSDGVDQVVIDNGHFSFSVLPSRGMGIFQGNCGGNFIGWSSPVGNPVNPSFINLFEPGDTRGWLKGFNECIVRCGLHSNGAACVDRIENEDGSVSETALNMHGLIANLPAKFVELQVVFSDPIELVVIGVVEEAAPFFPQYRLTTRISSFVGSSKINISESVENFGGTPAEFQMLYHCNFGAPFLEEGSKLVIPALETAPRDARAAEIMIPGICIKPRKQDTRNKIIIMIWLLMHKAILFLCCVIKLETKELPCVGRKSKCHISVNGNVQLQLTRVM